MLNLEFERGAHVCHLFENPDEQSEVAMRFIEAGLSRGEHCIQLASEPFHDDCYRHFQTASIDAVSEHEKGTLEVLDAAEWYLESDLNSVTLARRLWWRIEASLPLYHAVRIAADMRWTIENVSAEALCHWEATTNLIFENIDVRGICQYDLSLHTPAEIHSALRTHPVVIYKGRSRHNPYYEAPDILRNEPRLNGSDADASRIAVMLETLMRRD